MKKLLIIPLLAMCLSGYSQKDTTILNPNAQIKGRSLFVDSVEYPILAKDKISRNYYRMMLWYNGKYIDCIYDKNKFIILKVI